MKRLKVFISGTQDDLQAERRAIADAVSALGHEPLMAETYGTQPMPSLSAIREMIDRADFYIGVYGARYGWQMDNGVSVSEFEFTEFRRTHPRRILIYVKETEPLSEQVRFLQRVEDFKEGYFRRPRFTDTRQLAEWVKDDLPKLITRAWYDIPGVSEPGAGKVYLKEVATQKPYILWSDQTYIDRIVARTDDLFARTVARHNPREPEREKQAEPEPLEPALAGEKNLVLLGEPGMGKTTSLQHLAWKAAKRALAKPRDCEIPIYIELKYYNGEPELETLLARRVHSILGTGRELASDLASGTRILNAWLGQSNARFLLLLDGLNEVRPEHHTAVRGALEKLLNSPHKVVISCRERDYDASLGDRAVAFVLQGLQEDQVRDYLQGVLGNKGTKLFDAQIGQDKKMCTLAANPLMLWLIGVVAQNDPEVRLPKNRGKLFQQFVALMPRLREREGIRAEIASDVVETALAKLGFEMQKCRRLAADLGEVRSWQIPTADKDLESVLTQAKNWRLLKSDGRLGEPIEFLHQLFLEYFVALYLKAEVDHSRPVLGEVEGFEVLAEHLFDKRTVVVGKWRGLEVVKEQPLDKGWEEITVMLAGISDQPKELVKWLGKQVVKHKYGRDIFWVERCWENSEAAQDPEARGAVVDGFIAALRAANVNANHDAMVGAELSYETSEVLYKGIRAMDRIRDPRAVEVLLYIECSRYHGEAAIYQIEAREALNRIGLLAVEPLLHNLRSTDEEERCQAAWFLGEIGDSSAVELLIATLRDPNEYVRCAATRALGKIGDPRALSPLSRVAREDKGKTIRGEHIADLAQEAILKIEFRQMPVKGIIASLQNGNIDERRLAATVLGEARDPCALPALERVAKRKSSVADAAQEVVKKIRERMEEGQRTTVD